MILRDADQLQHPLTPLKNLQVCPSLCSACHGSSQHRAEWAQTAL